MTVWKPDVSRTEIGDALRERGCPYWQEPDSDNAKLWTAAMLRLAAQCEAQKGNEDGR